MLALPAGQRDDNGVAALNVGIKNLKSERDRLRGEIAKRFPNYAALIDPKPPTVDEIRASLKPDEALLSFYFGREQSFVWAVPQTGKVAFATIPATSGQIASKIGELRKALEPDAATISDIPRFDLKLAYELYSLLLKPVEAGWKAAKEPDRRHQRRARPVAAVAAADGAGRGGRKRKTASCSPAIATSPGSRAPTRSAWCRRRRRCARCGNCRRVRRAAIRSSASATPISASSRPPKRTPKKTPSRCRLPPPIPPPTLRAACRSTRRSSPQIEGVSSAELAQLPRLPDTAAELTSIAKALRIDPDKMLHLGRDANEQAVATADLSHYRIVDFATHGLVPGELNGLTQPALALTAPAVAGVPGDGLLTMEKILALKLDADWVVLSACNTGGRRWRRRRSRLRTGPGILLRRDAHDPGHQLVGAFGFGARTGQRPVPPPGDRSRADARRGVAPGDDGADRWQRLQRR